MLRDLVLLALLAIDEGRPITVLAEGASEVILADLLTLGDGVVAVEAEGCLLEMLGAALGGAESSSTIE